MNCLHPFTRRYLDALTGQEKTVICPCGKCVNCLHAEQDKWAVRLTESARYHKQMIFDTLTVSPIAMPYIDMLEGLNLPNFKKADSKDKFRDILLHNYDLAKDYYPNMSAESWKIIAKNDGRLLYFPKSEVQDWIKRGRIALQRDYQRRNLTPPDWEYFLVEEYGSKTSRPHFHILVFGLSLNDWFHFFGRPWRELYGWTRHVYKDYTVDNQKDFNCMIKYVSKYITKGSFESPLVTDGFYEKPYRLISKGIGAHYLDNKKFDAFRGAVAKKFEDIKFIPYSKYVEAQEEYEKYAEWSERQYVPHYGDISPEQLFIEECCTYVPPISSPFIDELRPRAEIVQGALSALDKEMPVLTDNDLNNLCVYYDTAGFPHALPRYYKDKLLQNGKEKNIYAYKVQTLLSTRAELYDNTRVSAYAASLGICINPGDINREEGTIKGLSALTAFMVLYGYSVKQKSEAKTVGQRRYTRLNNFYNRNKYNPNQNLT